MSGSAACGSLRQIASAAAQEAYADSAGLRTLRAISTASIAGGRAAAKSPPAVQAIASVASENPTLTLDAPVGGLLAGLPGEAGSRVPAARSTCRSWRVGPYHKEVSGSPGAGSARACSASRCASG